MSDPETPKPATARHGEPVSKNVGSGGLNYSSNSKTPTDLQVLRLTRRFALSVPLACAIAGLAYECGVQR